MKIDLSGQFAPLLPMFKELKPLSADNFRIVLDVGMPQIRGRAEADVVFVERRENEHASFRCNVRHALGMADTEMGFTLSVQGDGTSIDWRCSSVVRGTLASLARGILAPLARKNVDDMIENIRQALGASDAVAPAPAVPAAEPVAPQGWWARMLAWLGWTRATGAQR